jgi:uncharacterized protein (TIGR02328 family)
MRLWHYKLLPYLPELQFKGQLREMVAILHDLKNKGKTSHLLINRIMEYPKGDLWNYFIRYHGEYGKRYGMTLKPETYSEFAEFADDYVEWGIPFKGWHNKEYLRVCMANLYEKHHFGIGKPRITDAEWQRLCDGYKAITGEEYRI